MLWITVFTIPWEKAFHVEGIGELTRILGYATFALALMAVVFRKRIRPLHLFHFAALGFVAWNVLSLVWSVDADASSSRAVTYVSLLAFVWLVWELTDDDRDRRLILQALVLGCYVTITSQVISLMTGAPTTDLEYRYTGGGANQNDFALTLAVCVPISFALFNHPAKQVPVLRLLNFLHWPISGFAIILTGSRGGIICFFLASVMNVFWGFRGKLLMKLSLIFLIVTGMTVAFTFLPPNTSRRIQEVGHEIEQGSWGGRLPIYAAAMQAFEDRPLLGMGAGAFEKGVGWKVGEDVAHNLYLSVLTETGLIGLSLFALVLLAVVLAIRKVPEPWRRPWLAVMVTWAVGVFGLSWEYQKVTWLLFAMLASEASRPRSVENDARVTVAGVPQQMES